MKLQFSDHKSAVGKAAAIDRSPQAGVDENGKTTGGARVRESYLSVSTVGNVGGVSFRGRPANERRGCKCGPTPSRHTTMTWGAALLLSVTRVPRAVWCRQRPLRGTHAHPRAPTSSAPRCPSPPRQPTWALGNTHIHEGDALAERLSNPTFVGQEHQMVCSPPF